MVAAAKKKPSGAQRTTPKSKSENKAPITAKRPAAAVESSRAAAGSSGDAYDSLPPALVVNLPRRNDRWEEVKHRLSKFKGLRFERVDAVDGVAGTEIPQEVVADSWCTDRNWKYVVRRFEGGKDCGYTQKELRLTGGERGCAASHVALWRRCAAEVGPCMVLEDDAKPTNKFVALLKQAMADLRTEKPDLLYLGYTQAAPWRRKVSSVVHEAEYLWTTVGYIIWPSGAQKLMSALPVDQPVDNFMAHLMAAGTLRGFAVTPEIVKQAKAWNVDNDVGHSDDKAWIQNC